MDKKDVKELAKNLKEQIQDLSKKRGMPIETSPLCPIICATVCAAACIPSEGVALAEGAEVGLEVSVEA